MNAFLPALETGERHPCFFPAARKHHGRIHLAVAPGCNISCVYCRRDCDCVNESRPGVASRVLTPREALEHLNRSLVAMPHLSVAAVAGPGDAFHRPELTLATLEQVRRYHPEMLLCVSTNGWNVIPHIPALVELGVGFVTVTINAVDPRVGAMVYARVGQGAEALVGSGGAAALAESQLEAVARLKAVGITVKVNTVVIPGLNQEHVTEVARVAGGLGADLMNLIPLLPVAGTRLAGVPQPGPEIMRRLRREAGRYLPQMTHCQRCRSDAVGLLDGAAQAG